jgi:rhamnogalacturonan endolyase
MRFLLNLTDLLQAPTAVSAAFGYTDDGTNYVVNTGANLVVKVSKFNDDMISIKYNGIEYSGQGGKNSEVESVLGASTVSIKRYTLSKSAALKISVAFGTLRHYLVFRYNNPSVYIFMNKPDDSVTISRYIVRIPANVFKNNVNTNTD